MGLAQQEDMIQALAAKGADDPLDQGVLPGPERGDADLADPHPFDATREVLTVVPSRSRRRYFGAVSSGKASTNWHAVQTAEG